eukprot:2839549-Rhodomonas_salina.1
MTRRYPSASNRYWMSTYRFHVMHCSKVSLRVQLIAVPVHGTTHYASAHPHATPAATNKFITQMQAQKTGAVQDTKTKKTSIENDQDEHADAKQGPQVLQSGLVPTQPIMLEAGDREPDVESRSVLPQRHLQFNANIPCHAQQDPPEKIQHRMLPNHPSIES